MSTRTTSIASSVTVSLLAALTTLALAPKAEAQCIPGSSLCAQVQIGVSGGISGGIYIGPPAPPQVVYVQPQAPVPPPVVYYQQPQPQPPVVVYQPQQPQQQVVYVQQRPQVQLVGIQPLSIEPAAPPDARWGLHAELGAMTSSGIAMGGGAVALRLRPARWFAVDLGVGSYGGVDYDGNSRVEVPITANALFFVNPQNAFQFYVLAGIGGSYAQVDGMGYDLTPPGYYGHMGSTAEYSYFGAQLGIGLEWRLGPSFALNTDVRGFVRGRTDGGSTPEFTDPMTGQTTDTSGGAYWTLGATLYW
jgi:hypothetical protein